MFWPNRADTGQIWSKAIHQISSNFVQLFSGRVNIEIRQLFTRPLIRWWILISRHLVHEYPPQVLHTVPVFQPPTGTSKSTEIFFSKKSVFICIRILIFKKKILKMQTTDGEARQLFTRREMIKGKIQWLIPPFVYVPRRKRGNFKFFQCFSSGPAQLVSDFHLRKNL